MDQKKIIPSPLKYLSVYDSSSQSHSSLCSLLYYNNLSKRYPTQILTFVIKQPLNCCVWLGIVADFD